MTALARMPLAPRYGSPAEVAAFLGVSVKTVRRRVGSGALPGYRGRYVDEGRADPSGRPVAVPGRRHLLMVFHPAQAHRDSGTPTVSGTHRIDLPMLRSYAVVGDNEGYVSLALGVDEVSGYRVGELTGRIYLDVAE